MLTYKAPHDLLRNKFILITGAGDGIGREAAMAYGAHGAQLILLGRTQGKLQAVHDALVDQGAYAPAELITLDHRPMPQSIKVWLQSCSTRFLTWMECC